MGRKSRGEGQTDEHAVGQGLRGPVCFCVLCYAFICVICDALNHAK